MNGSHKINNYVVIHIINEPVHLSGVRSFPANYTINRDAENYIKVDCHYRDTQMTSTVTMEHTWWSDAVASLPS